MISRNDRDVLRGLATKYAAIAALLGWLRDRTSGAPHACLEATGCSSEPLALFLHQQGVLVSVVNPARIKTFA